MIGVWKEWLNSLDSEGGHIFILFVIVSIGMVAEHFGEARAQDIIVGAGSALLIKLKESSKRRENGGGNGTGSPSPLPTP